MQRTWKGIWALGLLMWLPAAAAQPSSDPPSSDPSNLRLQPPSDSTDLSADDAVAKVKARFEVWDQLEHLEISDEDVETIQQWIQLIQQKEPSHPWLSYLLGRFFAFAGRGHDAMLKLEEFLNTREGRNEWRAYRFLGDLYVDQYPQLAKHQYIKAAALKANEPSVLFGLSRCAFLRGDMESASRLAREAVQKDQHHTVRYISHLANTAVRQKNWDEALAAARSALRVAREKYNAHPGKTALALQLNNQYQILIKTLEAYLKNTDNAEILADGYLQYADLIVERSEIAQKLSLHELVRTLQSAVMRTAPEPPIKLLERYGSVLVEVGRKDEAVEVFETILERSPDHETAKHWITKLQSGSSSIRP